MQEKSLIKKNILKFLEYKGFSKYELYKRTGITRGVLDQNNGMSEENTAKFLAVFTEVSAEWLIRGQGPMLKAIEAQNMNFFSDNQVDYERKASKEFKSVLQQKTIDAQQKTIDTQQKYINHLEKELEKKELADDEQKRKVG